MDLHERGEGIAPDSGHPKDCLPLEEESGEARRGDLF
jgi:hypothetical protein